MKSSAPKAGPQRPIKAATRATDSPRTKKVRAASHPQSGGAQSIEAEFLDAFPPNILKAYRALFRQFDVDGSGDIDAEELHALLAAAGKKVSKTEIKKLILEVDAIENGGNGDGVVSESEFLRMLRDNRGPNVFAEVTKNRAQNARNRRLKKDTKERKKTVDKIEADRIKSLRKKQQLEAEAERLRVKNEMKLRQKVEWEESERQRLADMAKSQDKEWKKARFGINGVKAYDGQQEDAFYSGMAGKSMKQAKKTKKIVVSNEELKAKIAPDVFEAFGADFDTAELLAFCQLFAEFDADGSGDIDAEELHALLAAAGKKVSKTEIKKLILEVDAIENGGNGDGVVSESEFLRMLRDNRGPNVFAEVTKNRAHKAKERRKLKEAKFLKKTADKIEADRIKSLRKKQQLEAEAERLRVKNEMKLRQKAEWEESERKRLATLAKAMDAEWKKARFGVNGVTMYDGETIDAFDDGMAGRSSRNAAGMKQEAGWDKFAPPTKPGALPPSENITERRSKEKKKARGSWRQGAAAANDD
jgi:Ca2+-binding EF-hand superfamily protein